MTKFNKGDRVICKPGYSRDKGGSGYREGRIFTVDHLTDYGNDHTVYWPVEADGDLIQGYGVHERALELVPAIVNTYQIY